MKNILCLADVYEVLIKLWSGNVCPNMGDISLYLILSCSFIVHGCTEHSGRNKATNYCRRETVHILRQSAHCAASYFSLLLLCCMLHIFLAFSAKYTIVQ